MALPNIEVKVTADTSAAESGLAGVSRSIDDVTSAQKRSATASTAYNRSLGNVTKGSNALGNGIRNASYQISDFTVQVTNGQSVTTALSQQLPQLIGGFGTLGAVLSAVIPITLAVGVGMAALSANGKDVASVFGTLEPLARGIGSAMSAIGGYVIDAAELMLNNLDRILTIGATAAAFFAGKWVISFAAARIATFSLSAALVTLRTAIIRTGFGALIVGAGELVFQFTRLVKAAGGFSEALGLVKAVALEVIGRIGKGFQGLYLIAQSAAKGITGAFVQAAAGIISPFEKAFNFIASGFNALAAKAGMTEIQMPTSTVSGDLTAMADSLFAGARGSAAEAKGAFGEMTKPIESIQKIRDLLTGMKDENISLDSILFGGEEGDDKKKSGSNKDKAAKKLDEKLTAQEERIKTFFDRIKALTVGGLSDKLGAWGDYFDGLVSLTGTQNEKLLRIAKATKAGQALVDAWSAYNQVLADPSFAGRPWARVAAAGQVLAAGIGAVNAIKGVSSGGGSSSASSSGGSSASSSSAAASSASTSPLVVSLQGLSATDLVSGSMVSSLLNSLMEEAGDRGIKFVGA